MNIILGNMEVGMKKAFTLAEVLITLGIIGVVAAMTLPSLINRTQKKELQAAFFKTYSELNQAPVYDFTQYVDSKRKNDDLEQAAIDWINSKERKEWQERQKNNTKGKTR